MHNIGAALHNRLNEGCFSNSYIKSVIIQLRHNVKDVPESPAIRILSLPIFFPLSVNGLLLGICKLGITSCELLLPSMISGDWVSSSPLETIAWLPPSSVRKSISEGCRVWGYVEMDPNMGDSRKEGVAESGAVFGRVRRGSDGEVFLVTPGEDTVDGEYEPARSSELVLLMLNFLPRLRVFRPSSVVSWS